VVRSLRALFGGVSWFEGSSSESSPGLWLGFLCLFRALLLELPLEVGTWRVLDDAALAELEILVLG
jgi:hypothetical protein